MRTYHIAHITIEALTPLRTGSDKSDFLKDRSVQKDWNGLPMILGTSIAGVLRKHFIGEKSDLFGDGKKGSNLIVSNALLVDEKGKVYEELLLEKSKFLKYFDNLPIREHVAITKKGVAQDKGKFDEEVVYGGSRFKFSIELQDDREVFESVLNILSKDDFRLGGGSSKGFGKFKIVEIKTLSSNGEDYSSSLNQEMKDTFILEKENLEKKYIKYLLELKPEDFFMFGSGFGDKDADMTPVSEAWIDCEKGCLTQNQVLIPASSIKGAISHRTTFHYNLLKKFYIGDDNAKESIVEIFGEAKEKKEKGGKKGKILISDCYKKEPIKSKVFDHVRIDRFTAGTVSGALFQEKTIVNDGKSYTIEILLEKNIEKNPDRELIKAFENALIDITLGRLPLGGRITSGHGVFEGNVYKDGVKL